MPETLVDITVPDNSGTDAFSRFRYQAHVAFSACIDCAMGRGVTSVICEHIEDLLVVEEGALRFTQIKTRNPDYGLWKFGDLCRVPSGALVSLLRTHRAIKRISDTRTIHYDVRLEGALAREDAIRNLLVDGSGYNDEMAKRMTKLLRPRVSLTLKEAREVLARTRVFTTTPREHIEEQNIMLLGALAQNLPVGQLRAIYGSLIEILCLAMEGNLLASKWPHVLFEPQSAEDVRAQTIASKTIDADRLAGAVAPLFGQITTGLLEILDQGELSATNLTRKLRLAGAGEPLIRQAQQLRANATRQMIEARSKDLTGRIDQHLADLDVRLFTAAIVATNETAGTRRDGAAVFAAVLDRLTKTAASCDPNRIVSRDPFALMGLVCEISDQCRFGWVADDA